MLSRSFKISRVTTVQRNALVANVGTFVFNTDTNQLEVLNNSLVWVPAGGSSSHPTAIVNDADYAVTAPLPSYIFFALAQTNRTLTLPDPTNPANDIVDGTIINIFNFPTIFNLQNPPQLNIQSFGGSPLAALLSSQAGYVLYSPSFPFNVDGWVQLPIILEVDGKFGTQPVIFNDIYQASQIPLQLEAGTGKPFIIQNAAGKSVASFGESLTRIWQNAEIVFQASTQLEGYTSASGTSTSGTQDIRGIIFEPTEDFIINQVMYFDANFPSGSRQIVVCYANSAEALFYATVNKSDPLDGTGLWRVNSSSFNPQVLYAGESYFIGTLVPPGEQYTDQPSIISPLIGFNEGVFQLNSSTLQYPNPVTAGPAGSAYGNVNFGALRINRAGMPIFPQGISISSNGQITNDNIGMLNYNSSGVNYTLTIPLNDDLAGNASFNAIAAGTGTLTIQAQAGVNLNGVNGGSITLNQYDRTVVTKISTNNWTYTKNSPIGNLQTAYNNGVPGSLGNIALNGNVNPLFVVNSTTGAPQSTISSFNFVNPNSFTQPTWGYDYPGLNTAPTIRNYARTQATVDSPSAGFEYSSYQIQLLKNGVTVTGFNIPSSGISRPQFNNNANNVASLEDFPTAINTGMGVTQQINANSTTIIYSFVNRVGNTANFAAKITFNATNALPTLVFSMPFTSGFTAPGQASGTAMVMGTPPGGANGQGQVAIVETVSGLGLQYSMILDSGLTYPKSFDLYISGVYQVN